MSKGYYALKPCPVCDSASGKCRGKEDGGQEYILCMTLADVRKGHVENGYKCIKSSDNGFQHNSATFTLDNSQEWSEEQRREWETRKALRKADAKLKEQAKRERCLSVDERHALYSKILDYLKPDIPTIASLQNRGFSQDEIASCEFRPVQQWQKLPFTVDRRLPGIGQDGRTLLVSGDGYLCPLRDYDGNITALQLRLHNPDDSGRYRWVSSEHQTLALNVGDTLENPLAAFKPSGKPEGIALVEGTGAKPYLTSRRLNKIAIGAAGGQFVGSPKLLKEYLSRASHDADTKEVTIYPDAGDIQNKSVLARWEQVAKLVSELGYDVKFAWWNQVSKNDSDIDELTDYSQINYVNSEEFLNLASPTVKEELVNDWAWEQWIRSRKFTPDIVMNDKYFQFPKLPKSNVIVSVKASLGKGKTEEMIREIKRGNNGIHLIGYRNNLLFQTIARASENSLNIYHFNDEDGNMMMADDTANLAYCLDSILKVDGYFLGRDIYIDESCSVLIHALSGGTLGDNQAKAIAILSAALNQANRVFILDGNNSDLYTHFYADLCPNKKLIKIQNTHNTPKHTIKLVDAISDGDIKKKDRSPLIQILLQEDVTPWIYCDSKERTKVLNEILITGGKHGYCLNSESAGDDWAKEFLKDPDKFINDKKPGFIIVSPTAESGISVSIRKYFTHKFSFFVGVGGTNSQLQAMFRLRDELIPHYVFCPEISTVKDRSNPNTFSIKKFQETINNRILQSGILATQSANNQAKALEIIGEAISRQKDNWWEMSSKLGVIDNYEMSNLRKCLIHALEAAGHDVEILQIDNNEAIRKLETEAKIKVQKQHAEELNSAVEFESIEEAKTAAKTSPRKDTQRRIEKTFLTDRLPGIKDTPLWGDEFIYECYIKRKEFIRGIERYWLVKNFDVSQKRHESQWYYQATQEDFYSARVKRMSHDVIWALKELDILNFTDGREYHKNSEEVINLIKTLRERNEIQLALRIDNLPKETESGKERIPLLASLLSIIGFKNKCQGQNFVGNIRLRHYQAVPVGHCEELEDGQLDLAAAREDILNAVERKISAWMQSEKSQIDWNAEPVAVEPVAVEPVAVEPVAVEPVAVEPVAVEPVAVEPVAVEPSWKGLLVRIREGIATGENLYSKLISEFQSIGRTESNPIWNQYLNQWMIQVQFANGCRSVPCDWVELAG